MFFDKNLLYLPTWQPSIQFLYLIYFIVKKHDSDSATSFLRKDSSLIKKVINKKELMRTIYVICTPSSTLSSLHYFSASYSFTLLMI